MSNTDPLEAELEEILLKVQLGSSWIKKYPGQFTKQLESPDIIQAKRALLHLIDRAKLESRMVELDLFEQFMNQRENTGITRGDLYGFKRSRLDDLETRLNKSLEAKDKS